MEIYIWYIKLACSQVWLLTFIPSRVPGCIPQAGGVSGVHSGEGRGVLGGGGGVPGVHSAGMECGREA